MVLRKQLVDQPFLHQVVGLALALPALVAHHVPLVRQVAPVQVVQQPSHAVAFQPQPQFELVGRQRLEVIRAVEFRSPVDVGRARRFQQPEVLVRLHVLRSLEHHVLEQVRESRPPRTLVRRPDVVPQVHRHQRQPVIFAQDHLQPVRQLVFLILDGRELLGLSHPRRWLPHPCLARFWRDRVGVSLRPHRRRAHRHQHHDCQNELPRPPRYSHKKSPLDVSRL